jgi:hypothetical protein
VALAYAQARGLLKRPYMWLLSDGALYSSRADIAALGYLTLVELLSQEPLMVAAGFSPGTGYMYDNLFARMGKWLVAGQSVLTSPSCCLYDTIQTFARGIADLVRNGSSPRKPKMLYNAMLAQDFDGVTGRVQFDAYGNRLGSNFVFYSWKLGEVSLMPVGNWSADAGAVIDPEYHFFSKIHALCGNHFVESLEECDGGAGCASNCTCISNWMPTTPRNKSCVEITTTTGRTLVIVAIVCGAIAILSVAAGVSMFLFCWSEVKKLIT